MVNRTSTVLKDSGRFYAIGVLFRPFSSLEIHYRPSHIATLVQEIIRSRPLSQHLRFSGKNAGRRRLDFIATYQAKIPPGSPQPGAIDCPITIFLSSSSIVITGTLSPPILLLSLGKWVISKSVRRHPLALSVIVTGPSVLFLCRRVMPASILIAQTREIPSLCCGGDALRHGIPSKIGACGTLI